MTTTPDPQPPEENGGKQSEPNPIKVFYCYAEEDKGPWEELRKHMSIIRQVMKIKEFHHGMVQAGDNRKLEIKENIEQAHVILVLLSPNLLNDEDSFEVNEIRAISLRSSKAVIPCIIPIWLTAMHGLDTEDANNIAFAKQKPLPSNRRPISMWINRDEAYTDIVEGIRGVIESYHLDVGKRKLEVKPSREFSALPNKNPSFIGRKEIIKQLHYNLIEKNDSPQAVIGPSGTGKTQLAIEYAHRYSVQYNNMFLLNAVTRETLIKEYTRTAIGLGLVQPDEADQNLIRKLMIDWLEEDKNKNWLLILDNADQIMHDENMAREFLPYVPRGHVLLTAQKKDERNVRNLQIKEMPLKEMPFDEGARLLLRQTAKSEPWESQSMPARSIPASNNQVQAEQIIKKRLGGLPLALELAGAYIEETHCGLDNYELRYQNKQNELRNRQGKVSRMTPESVAITCLLAFEKIKRIEPLAADILHLCAFLAPDAIPETLFTEHLSRLPSFSNRASEDAVGEAVRVLLRYSLIHRDPGTATLSIHQLVKTTLLDEMEEKEQRSAAIRAVILVCLAFPDSLDVETWTDCQRLLPHVLVCARLIDRYNITTSQASQLLDECGSYLFRRDLYDEARRLYEQALTLREQALGPRDALVAKSLQHLGELNAREGNYAKAEQLLSRALNIWERLQDTNSDIASTLTSLAEVYTKQRQYDLAEQMYEQALAIYQQAKGAFKAIGQDLARLYTRMAMLFRKQKKFDSADEQYQKALNMISEDVEGDALIRAQIMHDQAELYKKQGKLEKAKELHEQALAIRERVAEKQRKLTQTGQLPLQGQDTQILVQKEGSRDIAESYNSLGGLHMRLGNGEKAEEFYKKALDMRQAVLGPDNPETAESMYDLARLYRNWGKIREAVYYYRQALAIREKRPGLGDFTTLDNQKALADFYQSRRRWRDAEELYEKALASRYKLLKLDDPTIEKNIEYLARLYETHHEHAKEEELYKEAFSRYARRFGPDDPLTQRYRQKLVELYKKGSDKDGRLAWLYVQTFDLRARYLRKDNIHTIKDFIQSVNDLAELYKSQKQTKNLKELYTLALHICHEQLGANDLVTLWYQDALMNLSGSSRARSNGRKPEKSVKPQQPARPGGLVQKSFSQSHVIEFPIDQFQDEEQQLLEVQDEEQQLEQKLQEAYEQVGVGGPAAIKQRHDLAQLYEQHEKPEEAERIYQEALLLCALELGSEHVVTIECQNDLARCYWNHGKYDEAKPLIQETLQTCQPMLETDGLSKEYVLACVHSLDNAALLYLRELDTRQLALRQRHWMGGEPTKAEKLLKQALAICTKELGEKHDETIVIREHYVDMLRKMGLHVEAGINKIRTRTIPQKEDQRSEDNTQPVQQKSEDNNQPLVEENAQK